MVRLNGTTALLIAANLAAFAVFGFIGFNGDIDAIRNEIFQTENLLPNLKQQFEWIEKANACIEKPPEADGAALLANLTRLCTRLGVETEEAAQLSGRIPELKLRGSGSFNNISMVLNSVIGDKAVLIKHLKLEQADEERWEFESRIAVRKGEWEYLPTQETSPIPAEFNENYAPIHGGKPFALSRMASPKPEIHKENIRYIGFFAAEATASVIIETGGKFAVLNCGDKTPGGAVITGANADELHLSMTTGDKETEWVVKMEKK
ncbi:MAG: hypothetical protein ACOYXC_14065 [Candidatus Rifleibacteriota bacterium]